MHETRERAFAPSIAQAIARFETPNSFHVAEPAAPLKRPIMWLGAAAPALACVRAWTSRFGPTSFCGGCDWVAAPSVHV